MASTAQIDNLVDMLDGYVTKGGHHLNVNVYNRETLLDAQKHPENYPLLNFFLPYLLIVRKVQPKDGYLSWEYLCKVLNITIKDKPQKHELKM